MSSAVRAHCDSSRRPHAGQEGVSGSGALDTQSFGGEQPSGSRHHLDFRRLGIIADVSQVLLYMVCRAVRGASPTRECHSTPMGFSQHIYSSQTSDRPTRTAQTVIATILHERTLHLSSSNDSHQSFAPSKTHSQLMSAPASVTSDRQSIRPK